MVSAMNDIRIYWLWLVIVFGPANPRIWRLSKHYDNAEHFVKALLDDTIEELTGKEKNRIKKIKFSDARKLLEYCNEKGINVYCYEIIQKIQRTIIERYVIGCVVDILL